MEPVYAVRRTQYDVRRKEKTAPECWLRIREPSSGAARPRWAGIRRRLAPGAKTRLAFIPGEARVLHSYTENAGTRRNLDPGKIQKIEKQSTSRNQGVK